MKSTVGPELLGGSDLQSAGLSRVWMATQKLSATTDAPAALDGRPATGLTSFRSFLHAAGTLPEANELENQTGLEEMESARNECAKSLEVASKTGERAITHRGSGYRDERKAHESTQPAPLAETATIPALTVTGETPVRLATPASASPRIHFETHQTLSQKETELTSGPNAATLPPIGGAPSAASRKSVEQLAPATRSAGTPKLERATPSAPAAQQEQAASSMAHVVSASAVSNEQSARHDSVLLTTSMNNVGAKPPTVELHGENLPTIAAPIDLPVPSVGAGGEPTGLHVSASRTTVRPIQSHSESTPPRSDPQTRLTQPANQIVDAKASKAPNENAAEHSKPQTAVSAALHPTHTDSASMAHKPANGSSAASHPSSNASTARELSSAPTALQMNSGPRSTPEGATTFARSSAAKPAIGESLAVLDNAASAPAPIVTHAGTNKVEIGFQDPSLGWVGVRATTDANGMHAAVLPSSPEASRMLNGSMTDLGAYLAKLHHPVQSLTIEPPQAAGLGNTGSSYDGASSGQGHSQESGHNQPTETSSQRTMDRELASSAYGEAPGSVASSAIYAASEGASISVFA